MAGLEGRVLPGDFQKRVHHLLLRTHGAVEAGLLLRGPGAGQDIAQGLLGLRRRVLDERQQHIGIAHPLALIRLQNVLLIRVGADEVLERLDPPIDLLLPGELRQRLRPVFLGLGRGGGAGLPHGNFPQLRLLPGQREGEVADFRRHLAQGLARALHRLAQKRERRPDLAGHALHLVPHAPDRTVGFFASAHFRARGAKGFADERFREQGVRQVHGLEGRGGLEFHRLEFHRDHAQAGRDPRPVARGRGAGMRQTQLPALDRAERGQAVHDFLEVVPALQNPQALGYFLKAGGRFFRPLGGGGRAQRFQRGGGAAEIADEGGVRHRAGFFEVAQRFESLALRHPARVEQRGALRLAELGEPGDGGLLFDQPVHRGPGGIDFIHHVHPGDFDFLGHVLQFLHFLGHGHHPGMDVDIFFEERGSNLKHAPQPVGHRAGLLPEAVFDHILVDAFREIALQKIPLAREVLHQEPHLLAKVGVGVGVLQDGRAHFLEIPAHAQQGIQARFHFRPLPGRRAGRRQRGDARALGGEHEAEFQSDIPLLAADDDIACFLGDSRERPHAGRGPGEFAHEFGREIGRGGVGVDDLPELPRVLRVVIVQAADDLPEQREIGTLVVRRGIAQRRPERGPGGGKFRVVARVSRLESAQCRAARRGLWLGKRRLHRRRRPFERHARHRQRLGRQTQLLAASQPREALHFKPRGHDCDLQRARLDLAALEIGGHQFGDDLVARLHALLGEIPVAPHFHTQARILREHKFPPRALVHLHPLHDRRQPHVIARRTGQLHQLIGRGNEIVLRLVELHRREQIGGGAHLILGTELVLEPRLFRNEMEAVTPHRLQRHARRHPPVGQRHERDVRLVLPLLHP